MKNKWNVGNWTVVSDNYWKEKVLKIKGSNIIVGVVTIDYRDKNKTIVRARLSNINKDKTQIIKKPYDQVTDQELYDAWEKAFEPIDKKLLS